MTDFSQILFTNQSKSALFHPPVQGGPQAAHDKKASLTVLGGGGNTSPPLYRVEWVVDFGLWDSGSLLFKACVKLLDTGRNCHAHRSRASQTCTMVTCLVSLLAMQELGHFQLPGIVNRSLSQHEAVHNAAVC